MVKKELDITLTEDLLEGLMNLISLEEHFWASWEMTREDINLKMLDEIRKMRSKWLSLLVKEAKSQEWCESKHLLAASMRLKEVGTRFLQTKQIKEAKEAFKDAGRLVELFLIINKIELNAEGKTSA